MTVFRLQCCLALLLCIATTAFSAPGQTPQQMTVVQLQQENKSLQHKVRRLEAQVAAMREELNAPKASQIVGGIGYIVGIFGVAGWIAARNKNRRGD